MRGKRALVLKQKSPSGGSKEPYYKGLPTRLKMASDRPPVLFSSSAIALHSWQGEGAGRGSRERERNYRRREREGEGEGAYERASESEKRPIKVVSKETY